ncbi:FAD-dependent oxidoreductase [uncultured Tateyamaria sp.]|uniref:NAD(P)/FAD-dependent oxidoreductase n=1 Tax=uncultured Tateyamaria sp. TaxID=455651 RepID=UPI002623E373|nr:FAD-dependent oxidoreductase [uncultured Tateyamaria sp.]
MATGQNPNSTGDQIHWHRTAGPAPVCDRLSSRLSADVVVVGGGLTGTRTALGLAESGANVVLLEGRQIGFGASGRSGGQCNPMWRATPDGLAKRFGDALAGRLVETTLGSADALFADIDRYGIACDPVQNGWVQAAHCRSAQRGLERLGKAWADAGADIRFQDKAATARTSGSSNYDFSLFHTKGGHVQPLSLTRGFAHAAVTRGATLFENSPVTSMTHNGGKWTVTTQVGSVTAPQVILTTNAYSDDLWPKLRQTFFPLVSISLATAPLSAEQQASVLPGGVTIADTRRAIYYSRYDRDNRLVFGCVGSTDNSADFGGIARLKEGLVTVFPQLRDIGIEATWAGRIAVTPDMMPHLHEPAPGVLAGLGFSGRGIAMTSVMARTLVKKASGAAADTLPFAISPVNALPLHWASRKLIPLAAPAMTVRDKIDTMFNRG